MGPESFLNLFGDYFFGQFLGNRFPSQEVGPENFPALDRILRNSDRYLVPRFAQPLIDGPSKNVEAMSGNWVLRWLIREDSKDKKEENQAKYKLPSHLLSLPFTVLCLF